MSGISLIFFNISWGKVFKNEPSKICGRQPLSRPYQFEFLKGCHPQLLLVSFLNTLSHMSLYFCLRTEWKGMRINIFRTLSNIYDVGFFANIEAVVCRCSIKKMFFEISQNSQKKRLCQSFFFNKHAGLRPATLL